jgi:hypothetical protein
LFRNIFFLAPALVITWGRKIIVFRRGVFAHPAKLFIVLAARQGSWWILRPFHQFVLGCIQPAATGVRDQPRLPLPVGLLTCWLNGFEPEEVWLWRSCGVTSIRKILEQVPLSQYALAHQQNRQSWPARCRHALELLRRKDLLLASAPAVWTTPWLILPPPGTESSAPVPAWWDQALDGEGLVIKPLCGYACEGIVHYRRRAERIEAQALFRTRGEHIDLPAQQDNVTILHHHWQRLQTDGAAAIAQPYAVQSPSLPPCCPSVVLRVITRRHTPEARITIWHAWLEIPLSPDATTTRGCGPVVTLGLAGQLLPLHGEMLHAGQREELARWLDLIDQPPPVLAQGLAASLEMHRRLPPIDAVAWDWVPGTEGPILLEGNGGFSLLEPQLLDHLSAHSGEQGNHRAVQAHLNS